MGHRLTLRGVKISDKRVPVAAVPLQCTPPTRRRELRRLVGQTDGAKLVGNFRQRKRDRTCLMAPSARGIAAEMCAAII